MNFSFISESASGKIFYLMVLGLYAHDQCRNAKDRIVMSFLSQTLCETAVYGDSLCFSLRVPPFSPVIWRFSHSSSWSCPEWLRGRCSLIVKDCAIWESRRSGKEMVTKVITKGFASVDDKMLRSLRQNSLRRWDRVCGLGHVSTSLRVPDILHKYGLSLLSTSTTSWWMERCHLGQTWYLCVHVCQGFIDASSHLYKRLCPSVGL